MTQTPSRDQIISPEYVLPCQDCFVPLAAGRNDNGGFLASGSAVLIARQIALTAKHVVADYHEKAEYSDPPGGGQKVDVGFSIELGSGLGGGTWRDSVGWCATADGHDIALLRLRGTDGSFPAYPQIDVLPPKVGELVTAYGFQKPDTKELGPDTLLWKVEPTVTRGRVLAIHHKGRDKGMYPFPVFETDARVEPSMSGGPVFNSAGKLCGVLAGGLPADEGGHSRSYFSMIWPAMGLPFQGKGRDGNILRIVPLLWAARFGVVAADNIDHLDMRLRSDGEMEILRLLDEPPRNLWSALRTMDLGSSSAGRR